MRCRNRAESVKGFRAQRPLTASTVVKEFDREKGASLLNAHNATSGLCAKYLAAREAEEASAASRTQACAVIKARGGRGFAPAAAQCN
jgi:hypothetical protein